MFRKTAVLLILLISLVLVPAVNAAEKKKKAHIIYETPTVKTLSQLYWVLGKLDPENDEDIDNFLFINECDLYRDHAQNEFTWSGIRDSARKFVTESQEGFPTHFELLQPLRLAEYDIKTGEFDVWEPYKVDAVRRFEVLAEDIFQDICGKPYSHPIKRYPKGLYVELNRPFTLDKIKVSPHVAEQYVFNQVRDNEDLKINPLLKNKKAYYETREAFLVMRLRIFSYQEDTQHREYLLSKVLGILEGYEIYGDKDRQLLLFEEDFKKKKKRSKMEIELKKRYQERLKKQMEEKKRKTKAKLDKE